MSEAATLVAIIGVLIVLAMTVRGGGDDTPPVRSVTFYGDSATFGGWYDRGMVLHRYEPDPVSMVERAALGRLRCLNRARNGLALHVLLDGGTLPDSALGEAGTVDPLAEQLRTDPSDVVVLGCGNVDALFTTQTPGEFAARLGDAISAVRAVNKTPVVRGLIRFCDNGAFTPEQLARREEFNLTAMQLSVSRGVLFIDLDAAGEPTACEDRVHPTMEYHQRIAAVVAGNL